MILIEKSFQLPKETLDAFEQKVEREKQSELLASLISQWLDEHCKSSLRENYIAGLKDMDQISLQIAQEFHPLEEEWHRALPE